MTSDIPPQTDPCFHFDPVALGETFVKLMFRRDLFARTPWGQYTSFEYFVCRARYLLTILDDNHIADMFAINTLHNSRLNPWTTLFGEGALPVAVWLSGLLKKRCFLDQVDLAVEQAICVMDNDWPSWRNPATAAIYAGAMLFDDPIRYGEQWRSRVLPMLPNCDTFSPTRRLAHIIVASLEWLDARHGTHFSLGLRENWPAEHKTSGRWIMQRFMHLSEVLRCGFDFQETEELQKNVADFIKTATPVEFQLAGVLQPPVLPRFAKVEFSDSDQHRQIEKFKQDHILYRRFNLSIPNWRFQELLNQLGWDRWIPEEMTPKREYFLFKRMSDWLSGVEPNPFWLRVGVGGATEAFDIAAALELDIAHRLPAELVDTLYQKLAALIHFDAEMYRQNAYALLMASSQYDDKAAKLLSIANDLDANQATLKHWPLLKMPRSWHPNSSYLLR